MKEGSGPVYITAHVGTEIVNPIATATTTITTEIVNDMDDASMGDEELEDSELTSEVRRMVDWQIVNDESTQVESPPMTSTEIVNPSATATTTTTEIVNEEKVELPPAKKKKTADAPAPKVCQFPWSLFSR